MLIGAVLIKYVAMNQGQGWSVCETVNFIAFVCSIQIPNKFWARCHVNVAILRDCFQSSSVDKVLVLTIDGCRLLGGEIARR
jgi:hypothetical protein